MACNRPNVEVRGAPIQRLELDLRIEGITQEERLEFEAKCMEGLKIPVERADFRKRGWSFPRAWLPFSGCFQTVFRQPVRCETALRVLEVTVKGKENLFAHAGPVKTTLITTGTGSLMGAALGAKSNTLAGVGIGAGVGCLAGLAFSPSVFHENEATRAQRGYLPWHFSIQTMAFVRGPGGSEALGRRMIVSTPVLAFLPPLKENGLELDEIRKENLNACLAALVRGLSARVDDFRPLATMEDRAEKERPRHEKLDENSDTPY